MIERNILPTLEMSLKRQAAVALLGPRQVGKTTLALNIAEEAPSLYLDLEDPEDRAKLENASLFLQQYEEKLVILDEIHRVPELFQTLRGLIDKGRRKGLRTNRFLLLGSASMDLLRQSGESLAGRIEYVDMTPINILETTDSEKEHISLWVRGGFPDSYLATDDPSSVAWRNNMIRTYLERDIPQFGPRIPAETLRRLWTMLGHLQGTPLNASKLAANLSVHASTITNYIDLLVDLLLVRRLNAYHGNTRKRLVKSPKTYIRDSGLLHALLGISNFNELSGNPVVGESWEGFVIENLLNAAPPRTLSSYYRTSAGAEIDLILEFPSNETWAIEIKRSLSTKVSRGFYTAREDTQPDKTFVVYGGNERYPMSEDVDAIGLRELTHMLSVKEN